MVERVFELKKSRSEGENVSREWGLRSTERGQWKGGSISWFSVRGAKMFFYDSLRQVTAI